MGELNGIMENSPMNTKNPEEVSSQELVRTEHLSLGNTIAEGYLKNKVIDLLAEINQYHISVRVYITRGILETLIRNISIPRDSESERYSKHAIRGILALKENQVSVKKVLSEIEELFIDHEEALHQAYTQLKREFEIKLDETRKILEQQLGAKAKFDVERQSKFREQWRKLRAELNAYYEKILTSYKQNLLNKL